MTQREQLAWRYRGIAEEPPLETFDEWFDRVSNPFYIGDFVLPSVFRKENDQ